MCSTYRLASSGSAFFAPGSAAAGRQREIANAAARSSTRSFFAFPDLE